MYETKVIWVDQLLSFNISINSFVLLLSYVDVEKANRAKYISCILYRAVSYQLQHRRHPLDVHIARQLHPWRQNTQN